MADDTPAFERGMTAVARGDWNEALIAFKEATTQDNSAPAQEYLSWAAWALSDSDLLFKAREEAFRLYRQAHDDVGAARMAMWLAGDYVDFRGDVSIASGWRQRARRLLEGQPTAPEHGWLLLIEGDAALLFDEDGPKARTAAAQAIEIGRQVAIPDIESIGLAMQGLALVTEGVVDEGMRLLDEAAAMALSGEMTQPGFISWTLCYLIYACERMRDYDRAAEWCARMRDFAEASQMSIARGICRVHLAGVMIWRGDWQGAEKELADAAEFFGNERPLLCAEAPCGSLSCAIARAASTRQSSSFRTIEWHPLARLGLAGLSIDLGRPRDAAELIDRFLRQVPESSRTQRITACELLVRIAVLLGDHSRAAEALAMVQDLSDTVATLPLRAATSFSTATVAFSNGDYEAARAAFEDALDLYERCGAPYESARARLELAGVLVTLGRDDRAQTEAQAAHEALRRLGSLFYAARAGALEQEIAARLHPPSDAVPEGPLTDRQVEILRLISHGLNDREIAAALVVSEHTVHRHVANILQRLDLPSRSAAVAYAVSQRVI